MLDKTNLARHRLFLAAGLVALALVTRIAVYGALIDSPYLSHPAVDAAAYDARAREIASGRWLGEEIFYQDPLYPYVLAVLYAIFGDAREVVHGFQVVLGCVLPLLVVGLARRTFRDAPRREAIAWTAGAMIAVSMPLAFYDLLLLKTSLGVFLTVAHLYVLAMVADRVVVGRVTLIALLAGVLLGLNLANRGNYLLLAPAFVVWVWWVAPAAVPADRWTRRLLAPGAYLIGVALVIAPIALRNYVVAGEAVLVTAQGGMNLWIGNNAGNRTGTYDVPDTVRPTPEHEREDFLALARSMSGAPLTIAEADRYFLVLAMNWARDHPRDAATGLVRKAGLWLAGYEVPDNYSFALARERYAPVLGVPFGNGYVLGALGWAGVLLVMLAPARLGGSGACRERSVAVLVVGFTVLYSLSIIVFFVFGRYRLPIYPTLACIGAWVVWQLIEALRSRTGYGLPLALLIAVSIVVMRPLWQRDWWWFEPIARGTHLYNSAAIHLDRGEVARAVPMLDLAAEALGTHHREALIAIGIAYRVVGRLDRSDSLLARLTDRDSADGAVWLERGLTALVGGDVERARGHLTRAMRHARDSTARRLRSVAADPGTPQVYRRLLEGIANGDAE